MTDINATLNISGSRPPKQPQTAANTGDTPAMQDFLGMVLSQSSPAGENATLQDMPQDVQKLAEKIAALLENGTIAPQDGLQLQGSDILSDTPQDGAIISGLTSDLSAALAALLQTQSQNPAPLGDLGLTPALTAGADDAAPLPATSPFAADETAAAPLTAADGAPLPELPDNLLAGLTRPAAKDTAQAQPAKQSPMQNTPQAQDQAASAQAQPTPQAKTETSAHSLMTALSALSAQSAGDDAAAGQNGFGQQGFAGGTFADMGADTSLMLTGQSGNASFASHLQQAGAAQSLPAQTSEMIALQIQRNAASKIDTFTLQLDPADLGRMDIELKFGHDGSLKAHLTVDRPETLALLQKDAGQLERILQQSGLNTDGQSLSFDLRQQSGGQERGMHTGSQGNGQHAAGSSAAASGNLNDNDGINDIIARGYIGPRGVNIMV